MQRTKTLLALVVFVTVAPTSGNLIDYFNLGGGSVQADRSTVSKGLGPMAFRFYNGGNVEVPLEEGAKIVDLPGFDATKEVIVYIHGFNQNQTMKEVQTIVKAFSTRSDINLIVLDWSGYSTKDYVTAVDACVTKLPRVAEVIKQMVAQGIPLDNFHLVGHSLGAQCASHVARRFTQPKLKIVTGLDPAGPLIGNDCSWGLTKGVARFVQIIHTDRWFYGTPLSCGDFDVFFNDNGRRFQPGCPHTLFPPITAIKDGCSHHRSWRFYAESVAGEGEYLCRFCKDYRHFQDGNCTTETVKAAYDIDHRYSGRCYLETDAMPPYGRGELGTRYSRTSEYNALFHDLQ